MLVCGGNVHKHPFFVKPPFVVSQGTEKDTRQEALNIATKAAKTVHHYEGADATTLANIATRNLK